MPVPVIDWLSVTVKHREGAYIAPFNRLSFQNVLGVLGLWDLQPYFVPMKGIHRYQLRYSYQGITVNEPYEDRLDGDGTQEKSGMGYNITMSGSGLRFFEDFRRRTDSGFTLKSWLKNLVDIPFYEVSFSRIDIALDDLTEVVTDKKPLLDFGKIMSCVQAGRFKSRAKSMCVVQRDSYAIRKDSDTGFCKPEPSGKTLYFGSRKSEKYTRIYDKLTEQKLKNPNDNTLKDLSHWIRCETEYKGDTAQEIVKMYLSDGWKEKYCAHLLDMLRFLDKQGNTVFWWKHFCGDREPVHLRVKRKHVDTGDFIHMHNTFFHQMGRNSLTVMLGLGVDEFVNRLLHEEARLKKRHWSILQGYYHDQQLDKRGFVIPDFYSPPTEQLTLTAAQS